jgi:hypothetical protein
MRSGSLRLAEFLGLFLSLSPVVGVCGGGAQGAPQSGGDFSQNPHPKKLPTDVILVKGAWSSASDPVTALPEGGTVTGNVYSNAYFGLTYALSPDWTQKYDGPPPSDTGYYVLAQIQPAEPFEGRESHAFRAPVESAAGDFRQSDKDPARGSILLAAADLFFTPTRAGNTRELIDFTRNNLQADYKVERGPTQVPFAGHDFIRFDYVSPVAGLHWRILATQIRCHAVEFVFTSRDTKLIERLIRDASRMTLPAEAGLTEGTGGGDAPVCIRDYARDENILERVDPVLAERRFNPVPVRIVIDRQGKVKHIHFLSAFPDQSRGITDALRQWRFKPYLRDGQAVEVETGILFGRAPRETPPPATRTATK